MTITVVHVGFFGFVTDFGEPLILECDNGQKVTLPRYGVWLKDKRGLPEVVFTTNDLTNAKRVCEGEGVDTTRSDC